MDSLFRNQVFRYLRKKAAVVKNLPSPLPTGTLIFCPAALQELKDLLSPKQTSLLRTFLSQILRKCWQIRTKRQTFLHTTVAQSKTDFLRLWSRQREGAAFSSSFLNAATIMICPTSPFFSSSRPEVKGPNFEITEMSIQKRERGEGEITVFSIPSFFANFRHAIFCEEGGENGGFPGKEKTFARRISFFFHVQMLRKEGCVRLRLFCFLSSFSVATFAVKKEGGEEQAKNPPQRRIFLPRAILEKTLCFPLNCETKTDRIFSKSDHGPRRRVDD